VELVRDGSAQLGNLLPLPPIYTGLKLLAELCLFVEFPFRELHLLLALCLHCLSWAQVTKRALSASATAVCFVEEVSAWTAFALEVKLLHFWIPYPLEWGLAHDLRRRAASAKLGDASLQVRIEVEVHKGVHDRH